MFTLRSYKLPLSILALMLTLSCLFMTACSKQAWYQGVQDSQTRECINEQNADNDECRRSTSQTYDEYQKERVKF